MSMARFLGSARQLLALSLVLAAPLATGQELTLRHALQGKALDALSTLVLRFNDAQTDKSRIRLEDVAAVADKRRLPNLALLDPDDRQSFFETLPRFKPIYEVMKEGGQGFDASAFYPQMLDAVDDLSGRPQGLPMAMDVPVLLYNKDAFRRAGLDPERPPRTWWEVQQAAGELYDKGYECPLTTSEFAWIHIENVAAQGGGFMLSRVGRNERVLVNQLVNIKHVALLASWYKSQYFHYFGPGREGDGQFAAGRCAMLTGASSLVSQLSPGFAVGVAGLPYYDDDYDSRPTDVLPDGASLWVLPGKSRADYKVAARFIAFLLRPEVQREWVHATGYLPMTRASMEALHASGLSPAVLSAIEKRLSNPKQGLARARAGVGGRSRLRQILDEEIEFVWKNAKPAKVALDEAAARANAPAPVAKPASPKRKPGG